MSLFINPEVVAAFKTNHDHARVRVRLQVKIVFQLLLVAVINKVHARIYSLNPDSAEGWDIDAPLLRIVPA